MRKTSKIPAKKESLLEKAPFVLTEEQKNARLFTIDLKNTKGFHSKNASLEKFNFCLKNRCIGIGFTDSINSGLENPALEEAKKTIFEMRSGDLVWVKHPQKDLYWVATIQEEAKPTFINPAFAKNNLSFCCRCEFQKMGSGKTLKSKYGDFFEELTSEKEIEMKDLEPHRTLFYETMETVKTESARKRKNLLVKYPLLGGIALISLAALIIGILCTSRFIERSPLVEEMPSKVAGQSYIGTSLSIDGTSVSGTALTFDKEANQYFLWVYSFNTDSSYAFCSGDYYPVKFSVNPFGKHISMEDTFGDERPFYFTEENNITWGTTSFSTENIDTVYLHLVEFLDSDLSKGCADYSIFKQLLKSLEDNEPSLISMKKAYLKEKEKQKAYDQAMEKLEKALKTNKIYNSTISDLMNVCIEESTLIKNEQSGSSYTFTFTCEYRPNAYDVPNFYDTGTLIINFNSTTGTLNLSGEVADAMETYAVLKYGNSFGSYYYYY